MVCLAIIGAYALPHPPLAVPAVGRGQEAGISKTLEGFYQVAEEIAALKPETIIYITPHSVLYSDYFHISPGSGARGDFSRFGVPGVRVETQYDEEMVREITRLAGRSGIQAGVEGERDAKLDHGVTVPMWFINSRYTEYKAVRISQSGMEPSTHYKLGMAIAKASENLDRKTILIASSDMSHKLKSDGPYGFVPEGPEFDDAVIRDLKSGDFLSLMSINEGLRECAAECGYNSLMVLAGIFDLWSIEARVLSYEGPFGVGYGIAAFAPLKPDGSRNILVQYEESTLTSTLKLRESEDHYMMLARRTLEHKVKTGGIPSLPDDLPDEMRSGRAGVFVSLHKEGRLRGCIGTIAPSTDSIAKEIVQNAVSAGLRDPRFDPVTESELPYLTYKVDVLEPAEPISGPEELDVKRYGVIVSRGYRRGLLLPNLDGVNTVEEQIAIAREKAGISEKDPVSLERFEVVRHE